MKHTYSWARPLLAALFSFIALGANAQQSWRPFRPGLIYSYAATPVTSSSTYHTMRVDSAYVTSAGDSVYSFNRRLRDKSATVGLPGFVKSRNNLFGALLRWRPGQDSYTLEALAQSGVQAAVSLTLFPRAAVGSTWQASTSPVQTATLISRSLQTISAGVQDTVTVISIAGTTTQTVRLSRSYGLLAGPQWLGGAAGSQLEQAMLPTSYAQSLYSPTRLFDVQPGDEFGYSIDDYIMPVQCYDSKTLRRVISRRLTNDSLIITYITQNRYEQYHYQGVCNGVASVTITPITVGRWALSLAGNTWEPSGGLPQLAALRLLTGEYMANSSVGSPTLLVGLPLSETGAGLCSLSGRSVGFVPYYLRAGSSDTYERGLDYLGWLYSFGPGVTTTFEVNNGLTYYRKTVNGITTICGSPLAFVTLLPTRAAQAAAIATLAPNPAVEAATLTLANPARAGVTLRLTDALGRTVWNAPVPIGQTAVVVPLAGQPAGLYLLHLSGLDTGAATWKVVHE
jgi:hypothetical protein